MECRIGHSNLASKKRDRTQEDLAHERIAQEGNGTPLEGAKEVGSSDRVPLLSSFRVSRPHPIAQERVATQCAIGKDEAGRRSRSASLLLRAECGQAAIRSERRGVGSRAHACRQPGRHLEPRKAAGGHEGTQRAATRCHRHRRLVL
eukprot:scaffold84674_cov31-Tisochrysis_lutea.AAC.2